MKIIKPQKLGLLSQVFENDGQAYIVLTAMGFFPFAEPRKLLHEVTLWKAATEQLGRDTILDAAMTKQRGEVLVAGSAYSPSGEPVPAVAVRVQIASVDKQLYVFGDRVWKTTGPTDPVPFESTPLTWDRAFGGEGFARNPLGKGHKAIKDEDGQSFHPLPNIEDPKNIVKSPRDKPEPAGFGALDQTWPQRMEKVGTYDDEWLKTRFPGYAKDFDWEFFNVAPPDQRIKGYFKLDERFRVEGMHPKERVQESHLPGVTARLFIVRKTQDGSEETVEAVSRLDTVHLFPSIARGLVIFRGMLPIDEDDGADVRHIIAAFEDPAAPRSVEHYQQVLEKRLDKKRGVLHALIDRDLMPTWEFEEKESLPEDDWNDMTKVVELEDLQTAYVKRKADKELALVREHFIAQGMDPAEFDKKLPPPEEAPPKDLEKFGDYLDRLEVQVEAAKKESEEKQNQAMTRARAECEKMGVDFDELLEQRKKEGGGPPAFRADAELERMRDMAELGRNAGMDVSEFEEKLKAPGFEAKLREAEKGLLDSYRRFTHFFPEAKTLDAESSERVRAEVMAAKARGESLAQRDLTGADLSEMDLSGVDLSEALLERVNLTRATLKGTRLRGATLARATLVEANLEEADLFGTNFGAADLKRANLSGAELSEAIFFQSDLRGTLIHGATINKVQFLETMLEGVNMSGAHAEGLTFFEVDLTGAKFVGATLDTATFFRCKLEGADFSQAVLPKTSIVESKCDGSSFFQANLEGTRFALAASFAKSDFRGAQMKQTLLRGCNFAEADFSGAKADDCDFSEADLSDAKFYRTSAQRSLFIRTNFQRADAKASNFMFAIFQKAKLHGADFRGANFFRADMAKLRGDKTTRFDDAYLIQIRVVPEKNEPKVMP